MVGWELADPRVSPIQDAFRDRAELGQISIRIWFEEKRRKFVPPNIGPGTLVVGHIGRSQGDVAIRVGGRLVHRHAERFH